MHNLVDGTLAEAIEVLAKVAMEKKAISLGSIGDTIKDNPALSHGLIGAGVGAGLSGLSTAYGNEDKDPNDRRSVFQSMLTGGLLGGAAGAGAGLARTGLAGIKTPSTGPTGSSAIQSSLPANQYVDPETGALKQVKPMPPEAMEQIRELNQASLGGRVFSGIKDTWKGLNNVAPISAHVLPGVMAADAALHLPLVGAARTTADRIGGYYGREFLSKGLEKLNDKVMPADIKNAIISNAAPGVTPITEGVPSSAGPQSQVITSEVGGFPKTLRERLAASLGKKTTNPKGLLDILGHKSGLGIGKAPVATITQPKFRTETATTYPYTDASGNPDRSRAVTHESRVYDGPGKPSVAEAGHIGQAKALGAELHPRFEGRSLYKVPMTNMAYRGAKSLPAAVLSRLLAYGSAPAIESVLRGGITDVNKRNLAQQLANEYSEPVQSGSK